MERLPRSGRDDVARRSDLDELGLRIELLIELRVEQWINRMLLWAIGTTIVMTGAFSAIARLP